MHSSGMFNNNSMVKPIEEENSYRTAAPDLSWNIFHSTQDRVCKKIKGKIDKITKSVLKFEFHPFSYLEYHLETPKRRCTSRYNEESILKILAQSVQWLRSDDADKKVLT